MWAGFDLEDIQFDFKSVKLVEERIQLDVRMIFKQHIKVVERKKKKNNYPAGSKLAMKHTHSPSQR